MGKTETNSGWNSKETEPKIERKLLLWNCIPLLKSIIILYYTHKCTGTHTQKVIFKFPRYYQFATFM